jgi:hypothetical protein
LRGYELIDMPTDTSEGKIHNRNRVGGAGHIGP